MLVKLNWPVTESNEFVAIRIQLAIGEDRLVDITIK